MRELLLVAGIGLVVSGAMAFAWSVNQIAKSKEQRGKERVLEILETYLTLVVSRKDKKLTANELNDIIDEIAFTNNSVPSIVCKRCGELVSITNVSADYFAYCPKHDEDLYEFETERVSK